MFLGAGPEVSSCLNCLKVPSGSKVLSGLVLAPCPILGSLQLLQSRSSLAVLVLICLKSLALNANSWDLTYGPFSHETTSAGPTAAVTAAAAAA